MFSHANLGELTMATLSIEQTEKFRAADTFKNALGWVAASAAPARTRSIYTNPQPFGGGLLDRAILFHLRQRSVREQRERFLERFHRNFWSGEGGAVFSGNCDHRFQDIFLSKQQEDFAALQEAWSELQPNQIVELGTNSGLLLNYLVQSLPDVESAIGIDLNGDQIAHNQASSQFDQRIDFIAGDGKKWICDRSLNNHLFVTNGGVLEYFTRESLDEMMSHISHNCRRSVFYASEPVAIDHQFDDSTKSIAFGNELSFSHHYKSVFESNGFEVAHQRSITYDDWKLMTTIAITNQ